MPQLRENRIGFTRRYPVTHASDALPYQVVISAQRLGHGRVELNHVLHAHRCFEIACQLEHPGGGQFWPLGQRPQCAANLAAEGAVRIEHAPLDAEELSRALLSRLATE